ncbi:MAG: exodeoxyribonuclease VII small subunit [Clostridia bacterium]|nr:exodeoxyribonuclease VII small subunit [Clostridia bacterium]
MPKKTETENENFEELIEKLEAITNRLENDKLSLDESVALFEEGMKLSKKCNTKLEEAEKKITMLINENGEISEENFGEN